MVLFLIITVHLIHIKDSATAAQNPFFFNVNNGVGLALVVGKINTVVVFVVEDLRISTTAFCIIAYFLDFFKYFASAFSLNLDDFCNYFTPKAQALSWKYFVT